MYYLRDGLRSPVLAWLFAFVAAVAALTTTPFTQPNSIALVLNTRLGIPRIVSGIVDRRADVARDHRRHQVDRPRGREAVAAQGRPLSRRRPRRHPDQRRRGFPACSRMVVREAFTMQSALGFGMFIGDALRHRARHLRERSRLRHRRRRVRHRAERPARAAGPERRHGGVHRLVRDVDDQRDDDPPDRRRGSRA